MAAMSFLAATATPAHAATGRLWINGGYQTDPQNMCWNIHTPVHGATVKNELTSGEQVRIYTEAWCHSRSIVVGGTLYPGEEKWYPVLHSFEILSR
ncbi:hypothetical protein ACFTTN_22965 [Streptomyces niveus]|uniref:hypothetical protein n=1 Tax=Streptomyces niveus TaxID=193462 RepID=UPI0036400FCF